MNLPWPSEIRHKIELSILEPSHTSCHWDDEWDVFGRSLFRLRIKRLGLPETLLVPYLQPFGESIGQPAGHTSESRYFKLAGGRKINGTYDFVSGHR